MKKNMDRMIPVLIRFPVELYSFHFIHSFHFIRVFVDLSSASLLPGYLLPTDQNQNQLYVWGLVYPLSVWRRGCRDRAGVSAEESATTLRIIPLPSMLPSLHVNRGRNPGRTDRGKDSSSEELVWGG